MALTALTNSVAKAKEKTDKRRASAVFPPGVQQTIDVVASRDSTLEAELVAEVKKRAQMLVEFRTDEALQKEERDRCRQSASYFVTRWCWTYDPRRSPSNIPFALFQKQTDFLDWLQGRIVEKECGIVEKSRDMGLSWLCVAFAAHQFLFVPGSKITFGSRKENLVDKLGDPDSLLEKLRQLFSNLPTWLMPRRYTDGFLKFVNKDIAATITGESGDNMGRGGRSRLYFLDEFAFVQRAQKVEAAVSNNSDVRIYVSTPNGDGNMFARKRFSGVLPVFRCHWLDDPRKNRWEVRDGENNIVRWGSGTGAPMGAVYPWYEKQKRTLDKIILAQEVDIDYQASKEGVVIPGEFVRAAVGLALPRSGDRRAALDVADEGGNLNVYIARQGAAVTQIESWAYGNTTQTAMRAKHLAEAGKVKVLSYDSDGVGAGVGGTLNTLNADSELAFAIHPIRGGFAPTDQFYESLNRNAKDVFVNSRAEMWWTLRMRFERTYEHVNRLAEHPLSSLISIPDHPELISQLSQPVFRFSSSGEIVIESKKQMKDRGIESPDYADTLAYVFAPLETVDDFGWMANA